MIDPAMAAKVPRLVADVDIRQFKLDPTDGFVLTRLDGRRGAKELALETGLPEFAVERALAKLEQLGVVERIDPAEPPPPRASAPVPTAPARVAGATPGERTDSAPSPERRPLPAFVSLSEPKYDPAELDEDVDIDRDLKQRILDLYYRLDDLDHYTLLGTPRDADKKTVKRAYFELAARMHPDRFFKKNLGSFKAKMEALFERITEAHDTLVDKTKRADYDAYIDEVAGARGMESMLERALEEAARTQAQHAPTPAPAPPPSGPTLTPEPPARTASGVTLAAPSAEEIRARKEALARRLVGGQRPSTSGMRAVSAPAPAPNPLAYENTADAAAALKRRYEARIGGAAGAQVRKFTQSAEESLAKGDVVAAATALGVAMSFAPNDPALAARHREARAAADQVLSASYTKQAEYEEKNALWTEAARSWQKVAKMSPDRAEASERAARALLNADGDLHLAAEHAKRALALSPQKVSLYVILAEVYSKAGLHASARRAAEMGLALDPQNAALAAIAKRFAKG